MNYFLLMMGGTGSRFGESRPKQYTLFKDVPLFSYITKKASLIKAIDRIVVVSHADWIDYVNEWCEKTISSIPFDVVVGGASRSESVLNGLRKINEVREASPQDVVLIHDATHPYADENAINELIEEVKLHGGATLASKNYDTVYEQDENGFLNKVLRRELVVAGASPEAFLFEKIYPVYNEATPEELNKMTSAGAIALEHDIKMKVVPTDTLNLKITYKRDMELFEDLCDSYFFNSLEGNND